MVIAKDSPNFIGNHIALYGVMQILKQVESGAFTIEEVDAMTGPALGRPKSATFRTLDLAGIDILAHVVRNLYERLPDEAARREFVPAALRREDDRTARWSARRPAQGVLQAVSTSPTARPRRRVRRDES